MFVVFAVNRLFGQVSWFHAPAVVSELSPVRVERGMDIGRFFLVIFCLCLSHLSIFFVTGFITRLQERNVTANLGDSLENVIRAEFVAFRAER